jgi:hypothetical protein
MIANHTSLVFLLAAGLLSVVFGGSLKGPTSTAGTGTATNDVAKKPVEEGVQRRLAEALNKIEKLTADHLIRQLQEPPPPLYLPGLVAKRLGSSLLRRYKPLPTFSSLRCLKHLAILHLRG